MHVAAASSGSSGSARAPRLAPHETTVELIALTSTGDAALTVDANNAARLWPTLDGTREPVVVRLVTAFELALARDAAGFIAAALDQAGGIEIVRLDRDGQLRGRSLVTAEPGYAQIVAVGDGILGRRRDHVLVELDGEGRVRRTLAAPPGEQIATLVTRGDHVLAAIRGRVSDPTEARGEPPVAAVRRITPGRSSWGERIELPVRTSTALAVSPTGGRLVAMGDVAAVFIDLASGQLAGAVPTSDLPATGAASAVVGFLDDSHVVLDGVRIVEWGKPMVGSTDASLIKSPTALAFGGSVVVGPNGTGLQVARADGKSIWLGYSAVGPVRDLRALGSTIQIGLAFDLLWLDRTMRATRILSTSRHAITTLPTRDDQPFSLGDHHVLESHGAGAAVKIRDLETNSIIDLGSRFDHITDVAYDPVSGVIAIVTPAVTHQIQVDLKTGRFEVLPQLATAADSRIELVDRATGIAAVAISASASLAEATVSDGEVVATFPTTDATAPVQPSSKFEVRGRVIGVDSRGAVYVTGAGLVVFRDGKQIARIPSPVAASVGAVSRDGNQLALFDERFAYGLDGAGTERWRVPLWNTMQARYTTDGKAIVVGTVGGVVLLDAATGKREATGCGWGFGAHRHEPSDLGFGVPVVCAEDAEDAEDAR